MQEDLFAIQHTQFEPQQVLGDNMYERFRKHRKDHVKHALHASPPSIDSLGNRLKELLQNPIYADRLAFLKKMVEIQLGQQEPETDGTLLKLPAGGKSPSGSSRLTKQMSRSSLAFVRPKSKRTSSFSINNEPDDGNPNNIPRADLLKLIMVPLSSSTSIAGDSNNAMGGGDETRSSRFAVSGSRRCLSGLSGMIKRRLDKGEYQETMSTKAQELPALSMYFHEADERYDGMGTEILSHFVPAVLKAFVEYSHHSDVCKRETAAKAQLEEQRRALQGDGKILEQLESERLSKLVSVRELEKLHKARAINQLESAWQEDIRLLKEAHQAAMDLEMLKIRKEFEEMESNINSYYKKESHHVKELVQKVRLTARVDGPQQINPQSPSPSPPAACLLTCSTTPRSPCTRADTFEHTHTHPCRKSHSDTNSAR